MFEPPQGSFFVGYVDGIGPWRPARGAATTTLEVFGTRRTAEVKRMYVVPAARARGLARQVLAHLERSAAEAGAEAMVLETGTEQPEAIALYESSGYTPTAPFGMYKDSPLNRCFAKPLARALASPAWASSVATRRTTSTSRESRTGWPGWSRRSPRCRRQVATLTTGAAAAAGRRRPAPSPRRRRRRRPWLAEVRQLKESGKLINAIKLYREQTGVGLKEAKDAVEGML